MRTESREPKSKSEGRRIRPELLRDYEIDWRVQIRVGKNSKPFELLVQSDPARYLTMSSRPGDPPWAPYAVTFYSAFYDFSGQLVASVGLPVPPAPTHFQLDEADQ